ncbi:hypothetical protein LptCag_2394 [Leptospirillum ferriphilum]|uniref:Uncharacterized protein n=1 Tax=Leptospirillum ferriphilum TaxID=178606 RepID=A0A094WEJ5_9BACT|nr:hypothetical protein LptCag_2394 [Leptospirillum ferriphilum]
MVGRTVCQWALTMMIRSGFPMMEPRFLRKRDAGESSRRMFGAPWLRKSAEKRSDVAIGPSFFHLLID